MFRRIFSLTAVCLLAVAMLGAGSDSAGSRYGRVGHNLMCVCSCGQVLLECNHVGCPDSARMIGELQDQLAGPNGAGADSLILNWFVAKYGATVLAAPIRGGFDIVAWIIPIHPVRPGHGWARRSSCGSWSRRGGGLTALLRWYPPPMPGMPVPDSPAIRERIRRETEFV